MQTQSLAPSNSVRRLPRLRLRPLLIATAIAFVLASLLPRFLTGRAHPFGEKDTATLLIVGADKPENGHSRSDTMLLVRVQLKPERCISVLSLPRDTRVHIPGYTGKHRLNSAFSFGGTSLLRQTVESNFGVSPDYTITLHTEGMESLVEALGGVKVDVPRKMDYDDQCANLHIHLKPGLQRLSGEQAVHFVRFRKDGQGDLGRIGRQQKFMKAIANQAFTLSTVKNWKRIASAFHTAVETDLTDGQIAALALRLRGLEPSELKTGTLPGHAEYVGGVSYFLADTKGALSLGTESKAETKLQSKFQAQGKGWLVLNGSGRNGYARRASQQLQAHGQTVSKCGNAPKGLYPTSRLLVGNKAEGQQLQAEALSALGITVTLETDESLPKGSQVLLLGDDYRPASGY